MKQINNNKKEAMGQDVRFLSEQRRMSVGEEKEVLLLLRNETHLDAFLVVHTHARHDNARHTDRVA